MGLFCRFWSVRSSSWIKSMVKESGSGGSSGVDCIQSWDDVRQKEIVLRLHAPNVCHHRLVGRVSIVLRSRKKRHMGHTYFSQSYWCRRFRWVRNLISGRKGREIEWVDGINTVSIVELVIFVHIEYWGRVQWRLWGRKILVRYQMLGIEVLHSQVNPVPLMSMAQLGDRKVSRRSTFGQLCGIVHTSHPQHICTEVNDINAEDGD